MSVFYHRVKKGFDINLLGKAEPKLLDIESPNRFAVKPTDFIGMYRPKLLVKVSDEVKAGSPLFYDKALPKVLYTAPVSGEVVEIVRGEKRKLLEVVILADKEVLYEDFGKCTVSGLPKLKKEEIIELLKKSGTWPRIIQRPFGIVANSETMPKNIFISIFDTHPLAPDFDFIYKDDAKYFETGIQILKKLAQDKVIIGAQAQTISQLHKVIEKEDRVEIHQFDGKHPVGNVGIQISHIQPINKNEIVWTIDPYGVIQIGKLFLKGVYDASLTVALSGEVNKPAYYKTYMGACLDKVLKNQIKNPNSRIVSGNVLTGKTVKTNGFLGFYHNLISVIPEGNKPRFLLKDGWLALIKKRPSFYRAWGLFSYLMQAVKKPFTVDTSLNGEYRAFVFTGNLEKVLPMPIYPTHLIKSIMAQDFESMEGLGIYEVIEEDLALCEFIDVSKHPIQKILREGIDLLRTS